MFLIPIGHDHGELRRWPVISFAIMALCAAVWFVQYDSERAHRPAAAKEALQTAVEYYGDNPDLRPSPELKQVLDRAPASEDAATRRLLEEQLGRQKGDQDTLAQRQERLDQLTQAWLAPLRNNLIWHWGLIPVDFSWVKLLTSMFVHVGLMHLVFNMLFLYITGPFIEDAWGRPVFLAFYLLGGMFAGGMFAWQDPNLDLPLVGASGAVAAVMGAFLVRYPKAKIRLLTFLGWRKVIFNAPAWLLISLWFAGEYAAAWATTGATPIDRGGTEVANWAHLWGFAFGAAVAGVILWFKLEDRYLFEAIEKRREAERHPLQFRLDRLLARGDNAEACRLLATEMLRRPGDAELIETYWSLARGGAMSAQPSVCLHIIEGDLAQSEDDLALDRWFELRRAAPTVSVDTHLAVRLAQCLADHGRRGEAEHLLVECYRRLDPSSPPQEWAELAEYCLAADSSIATQVASRALAHPRLSPEARASLNRASACRSSRRA